MVQLATSTLIDLTDRPVTGGTITSSDHEAWRNDVEARVAALNDAAQALASNQSGTSSIESIRGSIFADTTNTGRVIWKGDPDGAGNDDEFLTRLEAYRVSLATGGTATFKLGGVINVQTTSASLSSTTSATIMEYAVPANTLDANGKFLHVVAFGTKANTNGALSLVTQFGAGVITTHTISAACTRWCIEFYVVRTGAGTQDCGSFIIANRDDTASTTLCDFNTATQDETAIVKVSIKVGNKHGSDVVSAEMMVTKYSGGP